MNMIISNFFFFLIIMSLLAGLIDKNSHVLQEIYVIFKKKRPTPNLKEFQ